MRSIVASITSDEHVENENATSSEIMDDVLKQLNKLGIERRNRILNMFKKEETTESGAHKSRPVPKPSNVPGSKETILDASIEDEVEILDLNEPKMGKYKRKRSKNLT